MREITRVGRKSSLGRSRRIPLLDRPSQALPPPPLFSSNVLLPPPPLPPFPFVLSRSLFSHLLPPIYQSLHSTKTLTHTLSNPQGIDIARSLSLNPPPSFLPNPRTLPQDALFPRLPLPPPSLHLDPPRRGCWTPSSPRRTLLQPSPTSKAPSFDPRRPAWTTTPWNRQDSKEKRWIC